MNLQHLVMLINDSKKKIAEINDQIKQLNKELETEINFKLKIREELISVLREVNL